MARQPGPMSEQIYLVLASLLDGPLHGHGIIKRAEVLSQGRLRLAVGTLYGALDRLAEVGLIQIDHEEVVSGRARRYFRLTQEGLVAVNAEALRMQQAAKIVTDRPGGALGWSPA